MTSLLIQALTLISGLVVNFVIPGLYGLDAYGQFIKANVLVFLFQKLLDIINEQLLASVEAEYILITALFMAGLVFSLFSIANIFSYIGSPYLLSVMLLSSSCLLSLFALRLHRHIVLYLIIFLFIFFGSLLISYRKIWSLNITDVLILTNLIPCIFALCTLTLNGAKLPVGRQLLSTLKRVIVLLPRMISITLVFNLFTNILPYILSRNLPARELGLFRVTISIIQAATSLFPVNVRAVFVSFISGEQRHKQFRIISSIALFYFSLLGLFSYTLAWLAPQFSAYLIMLPCLPVLYWSVLTERYLIACGQHKAVIITNLVISVSAITGIIFFMQQLQHAELFYALGFSAYLLLLHLICRPGIGIPTILWMTTLSPIAILLKDTGTAWGVLYMCSLLIIAVWPLGLRPTDLRSLRF